jgi:excisionase family DNA binding protein
MTLEHVDSPLVVKHVVKQRRAMPIAFATDLPVQEVVSVDEVAQWFGVDRKTVYNAAARGEIPHRRLGKRLLFSRAALVSWLACEGGARRKDAQDERSTR